jgi:hypothetical protein
MKSYKSNYTNLDRNCIGNEGAVALSQVDLANLTFLYLYDNQIGDEVAVALSKEILPILLFYTYMTIR